MDQARRDRGGSDEILRTPLHALHIELGGKMVAFAGHELPVRYPAGIIAEHRHARSEAALFDVSHMGQIALGTASAGEELERLVPADLTELRPGEMRYTMFTDEAAGILDDLIVVRLEEGWMLVVNAACKKADLAHLTRALGPGCPARALESRALIALQGPAAEAVLARHAPDCSGLVFMRAAPMKVAGIDALVSRSGYTGEDGFEISLAASEAEALARRLLDEPEVAPAGLGARDSLRLEAGLCLHGHDIDLSTTPIEAGLAWTIGKRRRREGGFPGWPVIRRQLEEGAARRRVGVRPLGAAPAREGTEVQDLEGVPIGRITSGGFGPTLAAPVAMGYVASAQARPGTPVRLIIRGKAREAEVVRLPFVPHRYRKPEPERRKGMP